MFETAATPAVERHVQARVEVRVATELPDGELLVIPTATSRIHDAKGLARTSIRPPG